MDIKIKVCMRLIVESNREVYIDGLFQWPTYAGLLEGLPTKKINKRIIERVESRALELCYMDKYFMIEPAEVLLDYPQKYLFGTPAKLPIITCVASLRHSNPINNMNERFSALVLIWFQNEYCFPIDYEIMSEIVKLPWSQYCGDYSD